MDKEERKLVHEARRNPDSFARLYDLNYSRVFNYLLYVTGDIDTALDLTSETFLKALAAIGRYRLTGAPFSAWLLKIASNEAKMYFRKSRRRVEIVYDEATVETRASVLEQEVALWKNKLAGCEEFLTLAPLLKKLKPRYREVIFLRFYANMSMKELGEALGRSTGTVKSQLHRGLKQLACLMQPDSGDLHFKTESGAKPSAEPNGVGGENAAG